MPLPALIGAAVEAVGGMTLAGLATGASIVGTGLQLVGMATGSKTLQKIGGGMSLVGGLGQGANALRGAISAGSESASTSSALLKGSNIDDVLSSSTKGSMSPEDIIANTKTPLKGSPGDILGYSDTATKSLDKNPLSATSSYGADTKAILERIDGTLTRYNMPLNILGGMGEAYMMKQQLDQRDRIQKRDIQFAQNAVDRRSQMPGQFPVAPAVQFNSNAYTPLLRN